MKGNRRKGQEKKIEAVKEYLEGQKTIGEITQEQGIGKTTLYEWVRLYQLRGVEGLKKTTKNVKYTREFKLRVIEDRNANGLSYAELSRKYNISNSKVVWRWVKKYNNHVEIRETRIGGTSYMVKGRKTSLDERVSIVQECLKNGKDYKKTSEEYQVSYQQVYNWVKKYERQGLNGLVDRRGKGKAKSEMTEAELLRAENKILAIKLKQAEMENELLKKIEEVERGHG